MGNKSDLILSFDLGTTAIKVGLFSLSGHLLRLASREQALLFPSPGHVEQDPNVTWQLAADACRQALTDVDTSRIVAVVSSTQRGSVIPLGKDLTPLTNLIVWMDERGASQLDRITDVVGADTYYSTSGHPVVSVTGVSKSLWLESDSTVWDQTRVVGAPQTLFNCWLGSDDPVIDYSSGSYMFPCDISEKKWSGQIAARLSFPVERLPRLVSSVSIVGHIRPSVADQLGLPGGIPIVAGGGDGQCAAAGTGVVIPGRVMVNIGTAAGVQVFLPEPVFDPRAILNCAANVVPDAWEMEGHTQASGTALRWFRDQFGGPESLVASQSGQDVYDLLVDRAASIPVGSEGLVFLPTFNGTTAPMIAPEASGAFLGLRLSHTRDHMVRAILEGVALEIRWIMEAMIDSGAAADELRLAGGGSKNSTWNQIYADVLNRPVTTVRHPDAAMVGAAMCAAVAVGAFTDFRAAAECFVQLGPTFLPDEHDAPRYDERMAHYVELFRAVNRL